ncbi:MAG: diguanylate cyclase [Myxococcota bacterium]
MSTILIIEDSESQRAQIRALLEESRVFSTILEAADGFEGLRLLMGQSVDVVLLDLEMPKLDGEKLLRMKDSSPGGTHIPFIFLTGSTDSERRARLITHGASDAIEKPFHPAELVARLRLHLKVKRLQDELVLKNASLAQLSSVDGLTGLRARRFVDDVLNIEFLRARRYRTPLAVVMADIDHFKKVNDQHGHLAGDAVLRGVSDLMQCMVRNTDVIGRYGGEEIIVVGPQNDARGAGILAERVRSAIEAASFEFGEEKIRVTASFGVAAYQRRMGSPETLLEEADRALYAAKQKGRNQVALAPSGR